MYNYFINYYINQQRKVLCQQTILTVEVCWIIQAVFIFGESNVLGEICPTFTDIYPRKCWFNLYYMYNVQLLILFFKR